MTRPQDAATEALADLTEACAKADGYSSAGSERAYYMISAQIIFEEMKARGYVIRKARKSG